MTPGYWSACYLWESPYPVEYAGTRLDDGDTDGDGVRDGADDQDHDDLPNLMELSRVAASNLTFFYDDTDMNKRCTVNPELATEDTSPANDIPDIEENGNHWNAYGRVNPFNPCLPYTESRTCLHYVEFGSGHAPFDDSPNWIAAN